MIVKSDDGSVPGQGTSAGYEITDGHCVSQPGNSTKTLERQTRRLLEGNHLERIAQDRQMRKQHAEAFANGTLLLHNDDDMLWGQILTHHILNADTLLYTWKKTCL